MSALDTCGESCAWTAAIIATVAYGTFGVPIKYTKHIPDVHPLVLQSYKTMTVFVTSWLVIFLNVEPAITPWGLVSGLLWVLGGTGGVYAIRSAGMAVAVGTWSSVKVAMSFFWGILIFEEPVADMWGTMCSFLLLALGLVGMSYYSAPSNQRQRPESREEHELNKGDQEQGPVSLYSPMPEDGRHDGAIIDDRVEILGVSVTKRVAGIGCAVFQGIATGSSLIPVHYAKEQGFGGAHFIISMAVGSVLANTLLWVALYAYHFYGQRRASVCTTTKPHEDALVGEEDSVWRRTYCSMPRWHFSELVIPGVAAGLLMSVAIFGCVLSVTVLGQGLGYSIVQTKILISGLWGIFWFKEISGVGTISKWFGSAIVAVAGIVLLGLEHTHAIAMANGKNAST